MEFWNRASWITHWTEESWWRPPKGRKKPRQMEPSFPSWRLPFISDHRSPVKRPFPHKSSQNRSWYCTKMSSEGPLRKTYHEKHSRISQEHSGYEVLMQVSTPRAINSRGKANVEVPKSQWGRYTSTQNELFAFSAFQDQVIGFSQQALYTSIPSSSIVFLYRFNWG